MRPETWVILEEVEKTLAKIAKDNDQGLYAALYVKHVTHLRDELEKLDTRLDEELLTESK